MERYTTEQLKNMELPALVDLGYELSKRAKEAEDTLKTIKGIFKAACQDTGNTEFMGARGKCVISGRNTTEIPAREFFKRLKADKKESLFWAACKVSVTDARKLAPELVEEMGITTSDPYSVVSFK